MMRLTRQSGHVLTDRNPATQRRERERERERSELGLEMPNMRSYQLASLLSYCTQESSRREEEGVVT